MVAGGAAIARGLGVSGSRRRTLLLSVQSVSLCLLVAAAVALDGTPAARSSRPAGSPATKTFGLAEADAERSADCLLRVATAGRPRANAIRQCGSAAQEAEDLDERRKWFYRRRAGGGPTAYLDAVAEAEALRRSSPAAAVGTLAWGALGPAPIGTSSYSWNWGGKVPYGGRVTAIAPHPEDPRTAYVGTLGGVWKTTNDGATWTPLFQDQASLAIGDVAVDPSRPEVVFAGTGEASSRRSYLGAGIFRSPDGGATWEKVGGSSLDSCHVNEIAIEPAEGRIVVVTADGDGRCAGAGLWRSADGGATFEQELVGGKPTDVAVAPNNGAVWFAGFHGNGIWRSADSGATWTRLPGVPTLNTGRVELDVQPAEGAPTQVVYAAVASSGGILYGVYRSDDSGATWRVLEEPRDSCGFQCNYDLALAVHPEDPDRASFGGIYLNQYVSGRATSVGWDEIHVDFHALEFDARRRLWVGGDGGIYRTGDGGSTFSNLNAGLNTNLVYPGISGAHRGPLYAGFQDNGSAVYEGAAGWRLVSGGDGFSTASNPADPEVAYTTYQYGNVMKIVDGVTCPRPAVNGLTSGEGKAPFMSTIAMHPRDDNVAYAGARRVFKTTNADSTGCEETTWAPVGDDLDSFVVAIAPAPSRPAAIYAATSGGLWVTKDSRTWADASSGVPAGLVTDVAVHPTAPRRAWAAAAGFGTGHVFRTTDFGRTWVDVSGNLPDAPAGAVVVDARSKPPTLYVGTDVGVFWSDDGGSSWQNTSLGLPQVIVMDLLLDPKANRLLAATWGRGVWSARL